MSKLGFSYNNARDIYRALGWPSVLTYADYAAHFVRQDIAKAIIDRPVNATWRGTVDLLESDDDDETALEKAWKDLYTDLNLKSKFIRLDRLVGLGRYGVLFLGFNDTSEREGLALPVSSGRHKLMYVKPLGEESAQISTWVTKTSDERYGKPLLYDCLIQTPSQGDSPVQLKVHYSRILHVADGLMESEVEGTPRLEAVFNRLLDLEKIIGGSAEMFWRGARPGYQGKVDKEFAMTDVARDDLQDQMDEYEHNLRRLLVNEGVELSPLAMQVADPSSHVNIQLEMISAVTGIPKRILVGSERGELASSEDRGEWRELIQTRREEHAEQNIIRPFVSMCNEYGVLPEPKEEYSVQWTDLWAPGELEKAEVGKARSMALKDYGSSPTNQDVVPPEAFYKFFLGLDEDQISLIQEMRDAQIAEEEADFAAVGQGEGVVEKKVSEEGVVE